jgi:murein DD-endopeptidase MepM/ murein hydrolase activator NlpD
VVKAKENLFRIGKAYDVDYRRLARINRIADPTQIRIGQRIFIPWATRQLPVEIITPSKVTLKRPLKPKPRGKGRNGFVWPIRGKVTSKFGRRGKSFHDGVDVSAPKGTPIRAIQKGTVLFSDKLRGYGNIVIIRHPGRFVSVYAHNRKNLARKGQRVAKGQVIGEVGSTGRTTGSHLHLEIRKGNVAQNPLYYLPSL